LAFQLGVYQRTGDFESDAIADRESLSTAQSRITGRSWSGYEQDFAGAVQHHKRSTHVREPFQRTQACESILRDADQTLQTMAYAGEPYIAALHTHTVLDFEMAGLHTHAYTETVYREHTAFADGRFARSWAVRPAEKESPFEGLYRTLARPS
jgi:hypothetical protein